MKALLVILNPTAGRGRVHAHWSKVEQSLRAAGIEFDVAATKGPLDALRLAEQAPGKYAGVVTVGGDGTAHEVVNGLLRASHEAETIPFGLIPLGTGDDFAKNLPPETPVGGHRGNSFWQQAVQKIVAGETRLFDAGRITTDEVHPELGTGPRYFINSMDVGFGAEGAVHYTTIPRVFTGLAAYLATVLKTMIKYPRLRVSLQLDDQPTFEQSTTMTVIMNGRCFANSFWVTPDALPDDGAFDLMVTQAVSRLTILRLIPKLMRGVHQNDPVLRMYRAQRIVIESAEPLAVEADGELPYRAARRIKVDMLQRTLRVFV